MKLYFITLILLYIMQEILISCRAAWRPCRHVTFLDNPDWKVMGSNPAGSNSDQLILMGNLSEYQWLMTMKWYP